MKTLYILICCFALFLSSCSGIQEIEENTVVTACFVNTNGENSNYTFYVSLPQNKSDDSKSESCGKLYSFNAKNFISALEEFESGGQNNIDIGHLNLFAANADYYSRKFSTDRDDIRKKIISTGLVYTALIDDDYSEVVDCINTEYQSNVNKFTKSNLSVDCSGLSSDLGELILCSANKYYTAAIPCIGIENTANNVLTYICGVGIYSQGNGVIMMNENEYRKYLKWRKKDGRYYNLYKITTNGNELTVNLNDKEIMDIARKYALMNIDVLNIKYYSMKNFLSYDDYEDYFKNYNLINAKFTIGDI